MKPADVPDGPLLVDTDVVTMLRLGRGRHHDFAPLIAGHVLAVSFATYGEVLAHGYLDKLGTKRMDAIRRVLAHYVVLPYSGKVAEAWAPLHARLSGHLAGKGTNDLWTAACALSADPQLPVVTNNLSDFRTIAGEASALRIVHPDL